MKEKSKGAGLFVIINLILLIIALVLIVIFILKYKDVPETEENIIVENQKIIVSDNVDKNNSRNNQVNTNVGTVEPIIGKNTNAEVKGLYNNKFYYDQLDSVSKTIYSYVDNNIENMKNGNYTIKLPSSVSKVDDMDKLNGCFQSALDAVMMDRTDLFYLDVSKVSLTIKTITYGADINRQLSITPNESQTYLENDFYSKEIIDKSMAEIDKVANEIAANAYGNTYGQIQYVHNWLIDNVEYDASIGDNAYNIYGALVQRKAVCEGYAEAFKYLMDKLRIPCVLVSGTATNSAGETENHEWNEVQVDGKWYAIDVTWDDPILINGGKLNNTNRYRYFMKGSNSISSNHVENGKLSTTGMKFNYPTLEANDY